MNYYFVINIDINSICNVTKTNHWQFEFKYCSFEFLFKKMNSTREIITLQFGHYSNFIGTHFWNLQVFNYYLCIITCNC